uniref:Uncharacterized protein n=1 Tax=Aegilops tauschii subsp. strangulata TaxID=200361 RepID=A0A453MXZ8_AEGTS
GKGNAAYKYALLPGGSSRKQSRGFLPLNSFSQQVRIQALEGGLAAESRSGMGGCF